MNTALTKSDKRKYDKELLKFTFPAILEQLLIRISAVAGAAFLGQVGKYELSASSLSSTMMSMVEALIMGVSLGITVVSARFISEKDKVHRTATAGFVIELSLSILLLVTLMLFGGQVINLLFSDAEETIKIYTANYFNICVFACPFMAIDFTCSSLMRASGDSRTPFFITLVSNGLNLVSIFVCLNVCGFGYLSVAMCYVGTMAVSGIAKLCVIVSGKYEKYTLKLVPFSLQDMKLVFSIGIPSSFERFLIQFAFLGMQIVTTLLGTAVLAGYQAGNNVVNFVYSITGGFEIAMISLVGRYKYSNKSAAKHMVKGSYKYAMLFTCVVGTVMFVFAPYLVRIFAKEPEVVEQATGILRLLVLTIPLTTGFQAGIGVLKTGADIRYSLAINVISPNFIRIPIAFVLVKAGFGFMGLYIGCVTDYCVRAGVVIWRILKKRWLEEQ